MKTKLIYFLIYMHIFTLLPWGVLAWKPNPNHKKQTIETLKHNQDFNAALLRAGWPKGLDTFILPGKTVRINVVDHSQLADAIVMDLVHHFYNFYSEEGLWGARSSAEWALNSPDYPYSLYHFPEAWYDAHTLRTKNERKEKMVLASAIIGQCLHLGSQDGSQTEHTRGDQHIDRTIIEDWASKYFHKIPYTFSPDNWTRILTPPGKGIFELWDPGSLLTRLSVIWKSTQFPGDEANNILDATKWGEAGITAGATIFVTADKGFGAYPFPDANLHTNINEIDWQNPETVIDYEGNVLKLHYIKLKDKDGNLTDLKLATVDVQSYMRWKAGTGPLVLYFDDHSLQGHVDGQHPMTVYYGNQFLWFLFRHRLDTRANADGAEVTYLGHDDALMNGGFRVYVETANGRENVELAGGGFYYPISTLVKGDTVQIDFDHPKDFSGPNPTYTFVYRGASTWADDETVVARAIYAQPSQFMLAVSSNGNAYVFNISRGVPQRLMVNGDSYDGFIPLDVLQGLDEYQVATSVKIFTDNYEITDDNFTYAWSKKPVPGPHPQKCGSDVADKHNRYYDFWLTNMPAPFEYLDGEDAGNRHVYEESYIKREKDSNILKYAEVHDDSTYRLTAFHPVESSFALKSYGGETGTFITTYHKDSLMKNGCHVSDSTQGDLRYSYESPIGDLPQIQFSSKVYAPSAGDKWIGIFVQENANIDYKVVRIYDLEGWHDGQIATTQVYAVVFPYVDLSSGKKREDGKDPREGEPTRYYISVLAGTEFSESAINPFTQDISHELSEGITTLLRDSDDPTNLNVFYIKIAAKYLDD